MKEYKDLLKDPRWQKKRLEILKRDEWKCQICGNEGDTLHVHHESYCEYGMPWDTPDCDLITICEECHKNISYPMKMQTTRKSFDIRFFVDNMCNGEPRKYFESIIFHKGQLTLKLRDSKLIIKEFATVLRILSELKEFAENNGEFLIEIDDGFRVHAIEKFISFHKNIYSYGT
jgi:hypothetical protein